MNPFVKAGDVCPICLRIKLVSEGGVVSCPNCKREAPDVKTISAKIDELTKENERLQEGFGSELVEENARLRTANEEGSSLVVGLNKKINELAKENEDLQAKIVELSDENDKLVKKSKKKSK